MSEESNFLTEAIAAARAGNREKARNLLQQVLRDDPRNFRAWLWLAGLSPSPQTSLKYIERAERLQPGDPGVARARDWARRRLAQQQAAPSPETPGEAAGTTPAPPPQQERPTQGQVVDDLRRRSRAKQKKPRRRLVYAAAGLLLILLVALSAAFMWGQPLSSLLAETLDGAVRADAPGVSATPVALAAATATPDPAERFVSGQFEPNQDAASLPDEPSPTATPTTQPMQPKTAGKSGNDPRPTWTMTPSPTHTSTPTATPVPTFVSDGNSSSGLVVRPNGVGPNERWIDVNLTTQTLVAYEGSTPVFDSLISSGTWQYPTVTGQFRVWLRYAAQTMDGRRLGYDYYLPNVPYVMYFFEDYALHGTYWHNNFGTPMSHGCVNLPTPAAQWLFNWSTMGTLVNVHH